MSYPILIQQRCVHHITSLCIRNMTITLASESSSDGFVHNNSFLFFTLHPSARCDRDELFRSDIIRYSSNPMWTHLKIDSSKCSSRTNVAVRLWIGNGDNFMPALQWEVSLKSLICIGDFLDLKTITFDSNAVVFGMHKSFFASSSAVTVQANSGFDLTICKSSYSLLNLRRIFSTMLDAQHNKKEAALLRNDISLLLKSKEETVVSLEEELENIRGRISHVVRLLTRERAMLSKEKELATSLKSNTLKQENKLAEARKEMEEGRTFQRHRHYSLLDKQAKLSLIAMQLAQRRQVLLTDMFHIFPIVEAEINKPPKSNKRSARVESVFRICGVTLRESEQFRHKEDLQTSIGLGYTAQLLEMISRFLLVPLRYSITLRGSSSKIVDFVTEKMSDKDRVYPLHVKGNKERFLFHYGVFLLNKNVAFLRYISGLGTADIRKTLENVKSLLDERLGGRLLTSQVISSASYEHLNRTQSGRKISNLSVNSNDYETSGKVALATRLHNNGDVFTNTSPFPSFPSSPSSHLESSNDLLSMRHELLGLKKPISPRKKKQMVVLTSHGSSNSLGSFEEHSTSDVPSIESLPATTSTRFLTGLEPISTTPEDMKMSAAAVRAELFGKKLGRKRAKKWSLGSSESSGGRNCSFVSHEQPASDWSSPARSMSSSFASEPDQRLSTANANNHQGANTNFNNSYGVEEVEPDLC